MEQMETEAAISSLTHLESYYQSRYEYYLAMATEAKENRERVGLLLLDLSRDLSPFPRQEALHLDRDIQKTGMEQNQDRSFARKDEKTNLELPQTNHKEISQIAVVDEETIAPSVSQMKEWTLSLAKAMSIIESVSNSDSGKTLHKNYLRHAIDAEFEQKLSPELVELYLEEAVRQGYLELDESDNNCYRGTKNNSNSEASVEPLDSNTSNRSSKSPSKRTGKAIKKNSQIKSAKPYNLPESDKLKPTLFETIDEYITLNRPKRFTINDIINYLYPQDIQSNWDKDLNNKIRCSISNVLCRKPYIGKRWRRIKLGVYQPLT